MATIASLVVDLKANTATFAAGMKKAQAELSGLARSVELAKVSFENLNRSLGVIGVSLSGLFAIKEVIRDAGEAEVRFARLGAVLEATGHSSGQTVESIREMASELSKVSTFSRGAITEAAILATAFKGIKGDQFRELLETADNAASALKKDLSPTVVALGRALTAPANAGRALRQVNIALTASQQAYIKALVDTGQAAKASNFILAELQGRFGGAAKAEVDTFLGRVTKLGQEIKAAGIAIGRVLIPVLELMVSKVRPVVDGLNYLLDIVNKIEQKALKSSLGKLVFGDKSEGANSAALESVKAAAEDAGGGMEEFTASVKAAKHHVETLEEHNRKLAESLSEPLQFKLDVAAFGEIEAKVKKFYDDLRKDYAAGTEGEMVNGTFISDEDKAAGDKLRSELEGIATLEKEEQLRRSLLELEQKAAELGLTRSEIELRRLEALGAEDYELADAKKTLAAIDEDEQLKKDFAEGRRLIEQTTTPLEKFQKAAADIQQLLSVGALGAGDAGLRVAQSALDHANKDFLGTLKTDSGRFESPQAVLRGSAAAELAQNRQATPFDPLLEVQREQLVQQTKLFEIAQQQLTATQENKPVPDLVTDFN